MAHYSKTLSSPTISTKPSAFGQVHSLHYTDFTSVSSISTTFFTSKNSGKHFETFNYQFWRFFVSPSPFKVRGSEVLGFTFLPSNKEPQFDVRFGSPRSRCWHSYWQHPKSSRLGSALGGHQTFRRLIFGWEIGTAVVSIRCLMYQISLVPHLGLCQYLSKSISLVLSGSLWFYLSPCLYLLPTCLSTCLLYLLRCVPRHVSRNWVYHTCIH